MPRNLVHPEIEVKFSRKHRQGKKKEKLSSNGIFSFVLSFLKENNLFLATEHSWSKKKWIYLLLRKPRGKNTAISRQTFLKVSTEASISFISWTKAASRARAMIWVWDSVSCASVCKMRKMAKNMKNHLFVAINLSRNCQRHLSVFRFALKTHFRGFGLAEIPDLTYSPNTHIPDDKFVVKYFLFSPRLCAPIERFVKHKPRHWISFKNNKKFFWLSKILRFASAFSCWGEIYVQN